MLLAQGRSLTQGRSLSQGHSLAQGLSLAQGHSLAQGSSLAGQDTQGVGCHMVVALGLLLLPWTLHATAP